jgi:parvulin-like peptidyl-prolyl isomerase
MTLRSNSGARRPHRTALESSSRRTFYLNLFFGGVVLLGVLILLGAAGASYWRDHFENLATVNGEGINKDQFRERFAVENFRLDYVERQIRTDQAAGRISDQAATQQLGLLDQRRQGLGDSTIEAMIDAKLIEQLAVKDGVAVTEDQVTERLRGEATTVERRHGWIVSTHPEIADGATEPTEEQKAAAKAEAQAALDEIKAGKPFEDVAKEKSDDVSKNVGGDLGFMNKDATFYDDKLVETLFTLQPNQVSEVFEGTDGNYYVARVTDIVPQSENTGFEQEIKNANVSLTAFRNALKAELYRDAMETKLVDSVTKSPSPQRHVAEIYIAADPSDTAQGDEVNVRHILYSPNDDPQAAGGLPADDPAWAAAEAEAKAAYDQLVADPSKFAEIAQAQSDDDGTKENGGELGFIDRPSLDPAFAEAVFADGLTKDQVLAPVKSSFGWHIIQFIERRESPQNRIRAAELDLAAGKDFAEVVKAYSEGVNKDTDGDAGWIARNQIDSVRESAIFNAQVGGVTPVITVQDGLYLYKILEEATRMPDPEQVSEIEGSAFSNWYTARKNESTITRDYQSTGGDVPPVG